MSNKKSDGHIEPIFLNTVSIRLTDAVSGGLGASIRRSLVTN